MKILIVEDDSSVAQILAEILTHQTYAVENTADGKSALELILAYDYDLIILDVCLPELDGVSVCRQARAAGKQMPILLLTGYASSREKAIGLDAGADDYIVKPFEREELVARIRALLRRSGSLNQPILTWGELNLDPTSCEVSYAGEVLSLTPKEYALLELFLRNTRRVFSCGMILEHLWSYDDTPGEEAVRTHIKGLRQKLKAIGAPTNLIETVYGIGYRLKPLERSNQIDNNKISSVINCENTDVKSIKDKAKENVSLSNVRSVLGEEVNSAIAAIWERHQPRVKEQLVILKQATQGIIKQRITPELLNTARQEAHSLAGCLGTFGISNGSVIARQIEQLLQANILQANRNFNVRDVSSLTNLVEQLQQEVNSRITPSQTPVGDSSSADSSSADSSSIDISPSDNYQFESYQVLVLERKNQIMQIFQTLKSKKKSEKSKEEKVELGKEKLELEKQIIPIHATDLENARRGLYECHPHVVIVETDICSDLAELCRFLGECDARKPAVPIIIIGDKSETESTLHCLRNGRHRILERVAVNEINISAALREMLQVTDSAEAKVLIVDDDASLGATVKALLQPWGLNATVLTKVSHFWETLESVAPDLLILDVEMPEKNGITICQEVRNHPYWSELPIVFLTVHNDAETVNQVFSVGADDFVCKPIIGPELVTRIINRLERIKIWKNLAESDTLTKLANRHKAKQELEKLLSLSRRYGHCFCLILIDIDNFQQINLRDGRAGGDKILREIAFHLRDEFRLEDVVARWGGDEFVIGLYGASRDEGYACITKALADLQLLEVTFSGGIAEFPSDAQTLEMLYQTASSAMRMAANLGGNAIIRNS